MVDLAAIVGFWTTVDKPAPEGFRLLAARGILAAKKAMRDTLPAGLVHDPVVEIMMSTFVAGATTGPLTFDAACAASGVVPSVARRWIAELEQRGMLCVTRDGDGQWVALSDTGFADTTRTIDAVVERQAALLG